MTVTVIGMWEPGFSDEQSFIEWRMWKQTILAFGVDRWCMVGSQRPGGGFEAFDTMPEALLATAQDGDRIFLIPGAERSGYLTPNPVYIFGNASEDLRRFVGEGEVTVGLETPEPQDLFAACCLPWVLAA